MNTIGEFGLSLAVLAAACGLMLSLAAVRFQSWTTLLVSKLAIVAATSMLLVCSVALLTALVGNDFSLDYVARFTERSLPIGYRLAAFWAGQEGSLLLWAVLLAAMSSIAVFTLGKQASIGFSATVIATLAIFCAFFGLLILYAANPFALSADTLADGQGLNPMLQDPGMIAHPPILFLGYAGFTIPFALMVGALITRQRDETWAPLARRWVLMAWLFLSIGILLGAKWAYTTLGWGGFWGWDPVENASLLPWLTATAFVHSLVIQQARGMFRIWNAILLSATFLLCIFGTYVTRSGIVSSVHTFGQSVIGTTFFGFLLVAALFCLILILCNIRRLASQQKMQGLVSREGAILATNIVLVGVMLVVLIGTMFPVISKAIGNTSTTLGPPFYNKVVGPLGLLLAAIMSQGPVLSFGKQNFGRWFHRIAIPLLIGSAVGLAAWHTGWRSGWAVACGAIGACTVAVILIEFARSFLQCLHQENAILAILKLIPNNHRRYGAQLAHIGVILMVTGIVGSSVFSQKATTIPLDAGKSTDISGMHVTLQSVQENRGDNYTALEAVVNVREPNGTLLTLRPQRRDYDKWADQSSSIVAIDSSWKKDIYINLAGWDTDETTHTYSNVRLEIIVNPLVSWLWIGGWVLAAGILIALTPRIGAIFATAIQTQPQDSAKAQARRNRTGGQGIPALAR